ncbi:MAG: hypothetical protein E8A46_26535 [Bradyrhizobium sp.]|jgi:hypothetical protein|uniref:hypothetical protein n=1 Tax=Bradyrhizobium sp. TaxID=376 RepID=UPI00120E69FE|nr:hypothetical protein [Bradyrhizobium sp.]THD46515.1 MAG: hypothetical protein E8A46_26535 [Bradyrhizobium sp.]
MRRTNQRVIFATTILLLLSNAAGAVFESREAKLQAIKTVGIIAAVGDKFTFAKGGLTGLNNSSRSLPIGPWGLDDLIVQQTTAALAGRFQVKPVNYPRTTFAAIAESPIKPLDLVRGDPFKKLVETEVTPQGLDAYIVITKAKMNFGGGSRKVEGVGIITYKTVLQTYSQIHALYEIRVVDGKTFDVIEKMVAPPIDSATNFKLGGPSSPVDQRFSLGTVDLRDENLHRAVVDLIARSLPSILSDMHLR